MKKNIHFLEGHSTKYLTIIFRTFKIIKKKESWRNHYTRRSLRRYNDPLLCGVWNDILEQKKGH